MKTKPTLRVPSRSKLMNKAELEKHKKGLLKLRTQILNGGILRSSEELQIATEDLADEGDVANSVINQEINFSMRHRELNKLRAIEEALERIEEGTYGHCQECDDEIKANRLANQPWTTLCITHAEEREREQNKFSRVA